MFECMLYNHTERGKSKEERFLFDASMIEPDRAVQWSRELNNKVFLTKNRAQLFLRENSQTYYIQLTFTPHHPTTIEQIISSRDLSMICDREAILGKYESSWD